MVTLNLTEGQSETLLKYLYGEEEALRHGQSDEETADEFREIATKLEKSSTLNLTEGQSETLLKYLYGEEEALRHGQGDEETADEFREIATKLQRAM